MRTRRLQVLVVATVVVGALASGCSSDEGPDPKPTVTALTRGLASGDLSTVAFVGASDAEVQQQYDDMVAGLGGVKPTVTVAGTTTKGSGGSATGTATLEWRWPLGTGWTYRTTVPLRVTSDGSAWRVLWKDDAVEPSLTGGETLRATTVAAPRGQVLGAHGARLVKDRPVLRLGVDKHKVKGPAALDSAHRLAALVGIDEASYVKLVKKAGSEQFVPAIVYRQAEVPPTVMRDYTAITGVDAIAGELPLAVTKEFAAPILGTVGPVTAEMVKDHPGVYRARDVAGISGLQARYDAQLRGTAGVDVEAVDPTTGKTRSLFSTDPVAGTPLRLTLEPRLQLLAERILAGVGPASALVAIRPSTGALVAVANGPGNNGYNDATYGRFAPGSTFKTVGSLALVEHGQTPSSPVDCPTSVDVDGKVFTNDSFYPPSANGRITLATALANSCNTAFINERTRLGPHDLVDAAATLGMGVDHDLGFPAYFGNVVPPTTETTKAADMIGQGQVLASPMTMATVMASVVAGHTVVPQLVTSVAPPTTSAAPLTAQQDATLKRLLRGVVTAGTGVGLADVPGPPVIAKTGTAEFDRNGRTLTHAWMIAGQGDLAVCAFVDVGQTGAGTAGPLLERFLRGALHR